MVRQPEHRRQKSKRASDAGLRKRGGIWHARIIRDGKPHQKSLETADITVARQRRQKWLDELTATSWGETPKKTLAEAIKEFERVHFKLIAASSAERYADSIVAIARLMPVNLAITEIRARHLALFEQSRRNEGLTSSGIRRDFACLSSIYGRAQEWEWVPSDLNPVRPYIRSRGRAGLKEGAARTRYLSQEEEEKILQASNFADIIAFAIDTGLRKKELLQLRIADVHEKHIHVREDTAKGFKPRDVPLLKRAKTIAKRFIANAAKGQKTLIVTSDGQPYSDNSHTLLFHLQSTAKKVGIKEHLEWHDLRRTCGCRLLQDHGLSLHEVSQWLGHSDARVTQKHYAFLKLEHLQKAIENES